MLSDKWIEKLFLNKFCFFTSKIDNDLHCKHFRCCHASADGNHPAASYLPRANPSCEWSRWAGDRGGHVSMHGCQTRLKSDGWIDKGWIDTYTRAALHSIPDAGRGHTMQRWLRVYCRQINKKRMMMHFTMSPYTNQERTPLRGAMCLWMIKE